MALDRACLGDLPDIHAAMLRVQASRRPGRRDRDVTGGGWAMLRRGNGAERRKVGEAPLTRSGGGGKPR